MLSMHRDFSSEEWRRVPVWLDGLYKDLTGQGSRDAA